jgi:hypothetical protein
MRIVLQTAWWLANSERYGPRLPTAHSNMNEQVYDNVLNPLLFMVIVDDWSEEDSRSRNNNE